MFCAKCGGKNIDDATFCVKCGADLTKQTPPEKKHLRDSLDGLGTSIQKESDVDSFKVGSLFANRYEILSEGLKGGMGVVYKCKDTMLNKIKALKVIHPRLLSSKQATSRFRQEVAISQELNHENIVRVYDIESWDGKEYFTMEWVEGVTLRDIITERKKEHRPFSIEEAEKIISQLANALSHAHKYTIHRDIKPENILITNEKELKVKLSDFGIAKMLSPSQFTSTSIQIGTPYYMAPEQKTDAATVDKRADIYATGVVLFELLTLENTIGLELPSEINKSLPQEIDTIIKKAIATKPEDRYGDAKELSDVLSEVTTIKAEKQQKQLEEQRRQEEEKRRKEEAEKAKLEAEKIRIREQRQRQTAAPIQPKAEQKLSFNKIAIAAVAIVVIILVIYIYNTRKEISPEPSVISEPQPSSSSSSTMQDKPLEKPVPIMIKKSPIQEPIEKQRNTSYIEEPAFVKGQWIGAIIIVEDKIAKTKREYSVKLNSDFTVPNSTLNIHVGDFLPDFKMEGVKLTSSSNQPNNPALSIRVYENGRQIFPAPGRTWGWLFAKVPSIKPVEHETYKISLKEGIRSNKYK